MDDYEAFEKELIDAYKTLEMYATYLTGNEGYSDDLLQETLLRILSNSDKYEDQGNFNAWAKRVMKNIFLNERTSNEIHNRTFVDGYDYINDDTVHPLVADNDDRYSKGDIYKAISLLPARYAKMITMQMDGYKYEEIACSMNISLGCVKSTIFAAKNKLRIILDS